MDGSPAVVPRQRRVKASNLFWFISSRPYVPMADIRRRFDLETESGTLVHDERGQLHIGLPKGAADCLLELSRRRKIGLHYDLEFSMRVVVGVYPMRVRIAQTFPTIQGRVEPVADPDEIDGGPDDEPNDEESPALDRSKRPARLGPERHAGAMRR